MNRVTVIKWQSLPGIPEAYDYHVCRDEDGNEYKLDLHVSGELGGIDHKSIVGKTIEFKSSHPYISIANGVRIVED